MICVDCFSYPRSLTCLGRYAYIDSCPTVLHAVTENLCTWYRNLPDVILVCSNSAVIFEGDY